MRKYNIIYYLLFILLVTGAFASMAQNGYGLKLMGMVAFAFSLVFMTEFINEIRKGERNIYSLEPLCLSVLAFLFGLRVFYVRFSYIELLFMIAALLLLIIYSKRMMHRYRRQVAKSRMLSLLVLIFHLSIVLYLISFAVVAFVPGLAQGAGVLGFVLIILFVIAAILKRDTTAGAAEDSAFDRVKSYKDHSIIILCFCVLISIYIGLNRIGILPPIYSDEYPRAYFQLVEKATSKEDKLIEGKFRYQLFKARYEEFVERAKAVQQ